jgi:serine/threonine protein kinase
VPHLLADAWPRVEALFEACADLPSPARERRLAASGEPPVIVAEVRALLAADATATDGWLGDVIGRAAVTLAEPEVAAASTPARIGEWHLLRLLGAGGMGTVNLAERLGPLGPERVAIKLLERPQAPHELARRFTRERQALERLDHPQIARLLDSGTTAEGVPYLVMDYVDGVHLDAWCSAQQASITDRVRLLQSIAAVVQHAHDAGVVHRDLKPGNILVTRDGIPILLDFGVAKLLDPTGSSHTEPSALHAMTFAYASPEQFAGDRITEASDLWTLGVIAFELLTGQLPVDLRRASPLVAWRRISAGPPAPPSAVVEPARASLLRGVLDDVIMHCLRPAPAERPASARAVADAFAAWVSAAHG